MVGSPHVDRPWIALALATLYAAGPGQTAEEWVVAIGTTADRMDAFAAQELSTYLSRVHGSNVPVVKGPSPAGCRRIIVGRPETHALVAELGMPPRLGDEGFVLRNVGRDYVVAGGGAAGVVYGAYAFLEELGCRWFWPGKLGEAVPRRDVGTLGQLDKAEAPDFRVRWVGESEWGMRNRMNVNVPFPDRTHCLQFWGWYHTTHEMVPATQFQAHPEYFGVRGRRRTSSRRAGQLCLTHPEVLSHITTFVRSRLDEDPSLDAVVIGPNDNNRFCQCPHCSSQDEGPRGVMGQFSRRMCCLYRAIADNVAASHPGKRIKVGVYSGYALPPLDKSVRIPDNVYVQLCHNSHYCYGHSVLEPTCEKNAVFRSALDEWVRRAENVLIYEYYYKASWAELPWPRVHMIAKEIRYYHELGVKGLATQYAADRPWGTANEGTLGLTYYITAKLLWDADADVDALLDDYFAKFYGPAGPAMKRCATALETAMARANVHLRGRFGEALNVFPESVFAECDQAVREAQAKANTPPIRERVAYRRASIDYARHVLRVLRAMRSGDFPALAAAYREVERIKKRTKGKPIISKSGWGHMKKAGIPKLAAAAQMEPRDWITEAEAKLPCAVGFVVQGSPTKDEKEARRWARGQIAELVELRWDGKQFVGRSVDALPCIWIHWAPTEMPTLPKREAMAEALRSYVASGGSLFLTADALLYTHALGIESTPPTTGHHAEHYRDLAFHVRDPNHPIFRGLPTKIGFRLVIPGEPWAEPRWRVPDSVDGQLLAAPDYPGKIMVEYKLGKGRILAAGTPYFGVFADRTNPHSANVNGLTRRILEYLCGILPRR